MNRFRSAKLFRSKGLALLAARNIRPSSFLAVRVLLSAAIAAFMLTGCDQKEFCYDHHHGSPFWVTFDWRNAPEAAPSGMTVFFYPADSVGMPEVFNFAGTRGGEARLFGGRYHVIAYNYDTEFVGGYGTDSFHTHHLYTRTGSLLEPMEGLRVPDEGTLPRPEGSDGQPVVVTPDGVWGCSVTDVEVREHGVVTLMPRPLHCSYSFEIRNVRNIGSAMDFGGVLTGMSPKLLLHDGSQDGQCVMLPVPAYRADDSTVRGEFLTFGHHPDNAEPHLFGLYVRTHSGELLYYGKGDSRFDVTDQIHSAADPARVHFVIDGLELPEPETGTGGGSYVRFDDWEDTEKDIEIK